MPARTAGTVQSVMFHRDHWTSGEARDWLLDRGIKPMKEGHVTLDYIHYRIKSPHQFTRLRTKAIGRGIKFILGFK